MTLLEKVSYIRGLMDGLNLDEKEPITKLVTEIVDVLDEMAATIEDLDEYVGELDEYISEIDEDLELVEDYLDGDCDCDCGCDCDCDDDCDCEDDFYSVICPNCGEQFCVDDETAQNGKLNCPNCNEDLEFDLSDLEDDKED